MTAANQPSLAALIRRHEELRDAHACIVQALKYPGTVHRSYLAEAQQAVECDQSLPTTTPALIGEVKT